MDKKITIAQIKEVAQQAYDLYKTNTDGKNADYIPYLANINKNLFGISICLLNGQTIEVGDSEYRFGIESVSKVHTAILVLRQYGAKELLEKMTTANIICKDNSQGEVYKFKYPYIFYYFAGKYIAFHAGETDVKGILAHMSEKLYIET